MNGKTAQWLIWAQEIFSLSQSGLTYSGNQYDIERYKRLQEITAEIIASQSDVSKENILESFSMQAGYITPKIDVRGAVIDANRIQPMEFYHAYKIIFLCKLLDGEPRTSYETLAVDFFDPKYLPPLSSYRTHETMIQEVFAHVKDPNRPTAFD